MLRVTLTRVWLPDVDGEELEALALVLTLELIEWRDLADEGRSSNGAVLQDDIPLAPELRQCDVFAFKRYQIEVGCFLTGVNTCREGASLSPSLRSREGGVVVVRD
jgi:hypothetical protein